jgi:hypothetical protein
LTTLHEGKTDHEIFLSEEQQDNMPRNTGKISVIFPGKQHHDEKH